MFGAKPLSKKSVTCYGIIYKIFKRHLLEHQYRTSKKGRRKKSQQNQEVFPQRKYKIKFQGHLLETFFFDKIPVEIKLMIHYRQVLWNTNSTTLIVPWIETKNINKTVFKINTNDKASNTKTNNITKTFASLNNDKTSTNTEEESKTIVSKLTAH